jgi:hypothetical protein
MDLLEKAGRSAASWCPLAELEKLGPPKARYRKR